MKDNTTEYFDFKNDIEIFEEYTPRPGKSCKLSSSSKFRILQCPQNSVIPDKGQRETCLLNVDGA